MMKRPAVIWSVCIVTIAMAYMFQLALQHEVTRLSYAVSRARDEHRRLFDARRALQIEEATLTQTDRLEQIARTVAGLGPARPDQVVRVGSKSGGTVSGAIQ